MSAAELDEATILAWLKRSREAQGLPGHHHRRGGPDQDRDPGSGPGGRGHGKGGNGGNGDGP